MVMDDVAYDPDTQEGNATISVVQGVFSFVSGQIAKTGPDAMVLKTPVATLGIRGTKVAGQAAAEGEENTISLLPDADGSIGEISVTNSGGTVLLNQAGATVQLFSGLVPPPPPTIVPVAQIQQQFSQALNSLPPSPPPRDANGNRPGEGPEAQGEPQEGDSPPGEGERDPGEDGPNNFGQPSFDNVNLILNAENPLLGGGDRLKNLVKHQQKELLERIEKFEIVKALPLPPSTQPSDPVSLTKNFTSGVDTLVGGSLADNFILNQSAGAFGPSGTPPPKPDTINGLGGADKISLLNLSGVLLRYDASNDSIQYQVSGGTGKNIINMTSIEELRITAVGQGLSGVSESDGDISVTSSGIELDFNQSDSSGFAYILVGTAGGNTLDLSGGYGGYGTVSGNTTSDGTVLGSIIIGGSGVDSITGTSDDDLLIGGAGNDMFYDYGNTDTTKNDTIIGGAGSDTVFANATISHLKLTSVEQVTGSSGNNTLHLENAQSGISIDLGIGNDTLFLANGGNTLTVSNVETIHGHLGVDTITLSGSTAMTVIGASAADIITASSNVDTFKYTALSHLGDTVNSFTTGTDGFVFSRSAFSGDSGADGALDAFRIVTSGTDSIGAEYFLFNSTTNDLYYDADADADADASSGGTGVLVANMDAAMVATDITFVA
jgi:trimeric autotransporter adhesin